MTVGFKLLHDEYEWIESLVAEAVELRESTEVGGQRIDSRSVTLSYLPGTFTKQSHRDDLDSSWSVFRGKSPSPLDGAEEAVGTSDIMR